MPDPGTPAKTARLLLDGKEIELPIIEGTEGKRALDISKLLRETHLITLDEGFVNTGRRPVRSRISTARRRSALPRVPDRAIGAGCDFVECCYLLIYGELPNEEQLDAFRIRSDGTRCCTRTCGRSTMASLATPIRWRFCRPSSMRCRPSTRTRSIRTIRSKSRSRSIDCSPSCPRSRLTASRSRSDSHSSILRTI